MKFLLHNEELMVNSESCGIVEVSTAAKPTDKDAS
jgi:hypothetical protein